MAAEATDPNPPEPDPTTEPDPRPTNEDPEPTLSSPYMAQWDPTAPMDQDLNPTEPDPKPEPSRTSSYWGRMKGRNQPGLDRDGTKRWNKRRGDRTRLRNRRYAALRQLIAGGEYFSEEEMRAREPLLYEHYIGQYRDTETPPRTPNGTPMGPPKVGTPHGTPTWAAVLLRSVDEAAVQERLQRQRMREGDSEEDDDDDDDDDEAEGRHVPDAGELELLRQEFQSRMYQQFLDGDDGDFDYSQVDDNPDLDNLDIESRDAEERYFDEEEPAAAPQLE